MSNREIQQNGRPSRKLKFEEPLNRFSLPVAGLALFPVGLICFNFLFGFDAESFFWFLVATAPAAIVLSGAYFLSDRPNFGKKIIKIGVAGAIVANTIWFMLGVFTLFPIPFAILGWFCCARILKISEEYKVAELGNLPS